MESLVIEIVFMSLAVWRISSIISSEEFVFGLAQKLRTRLGVRQQINMEFANVYDNDELVEVEKFYFQDMPTYLQPTILTRGITCLWCTSFWIATLFVIGQIIFTQNGQVVTFHSLLMPFVLSALAIGYDKVVS